MTPDPPVLATIAGAVLGGLAGWGVHRNLATLAYRRVSERHRPPPRHHQAIPALLAVGGGVLAHQAATGHGPQALLALPVLLLGAWLAAVDADVQRLPFRPVIALTALETAAIAAAALTTQNPAVAVNGAVGGALTYLGFRIFHHATNAGIGYGDVTLAAPLGAATAAAGGLPHTWWWLLGTLTAAALYRLLTRQRGHRPLGPWLILGALLTTGWPPPA